MELLLCQAYSSNIKQLLLQTSLLPAVKKEYGDENKTQWCAFRLG